jgi:hypothetical protein
VGARAPRSSTPTTDLYLAITNNHVGLAGIFTDTTWAGGTWAQSFGRVRYKIEAAAGEQPIIRKAERRVKVRFAGMAGLWSTLIPLPAILDLNPVD